MGIFRSMSISASGLTAQRLRMDVISQNIANEKTTRTANGTPYRRRVTVFQAQEQDFASVLSRESGMTGAGSAEDILSGGGVKVTAIQEDMSPLKRVYDPEHPDADADGYVNMPNVDITKEIIDMMSASRAYEANVTAFNTSKSMALKALEIGR